MKHTKMFAGALVSAMAAMVAPSVHAQTVQVLTAGSSAQFGTFAVAAYALAGSGAKHYTVKSGACPGISCYAYVNDSRSSSIPQENGNLWVVWSADQTKVWAYLSVDSTVGVRAFLATPRAKLTLGAQSSLPVSATNNGYNFFADGTADTALPTAIYNALNNVAFTAANTDIRPEDALFATNRSLSLYKGSTSTIGTSILSTFSSGKATPVAFAFGSGSKDPISGSTISYNFVTLPIGAAPIVFLANAASGSATASATNVTSANAATLFSGNNCASTLLTGATSGQSLSAILREPLSGTMNTTQYSVFVPNGGDQEKGLSSATNPANVACTAGGGKRFRAIGTGDEVNAVKNAGSSTVAAPNTVGYSFFSYESTGGSSSYKYITLDSTDPISTSYSNGTLPTCPVVNGQFQCPIKGGASFPNLRNGSYKAWSVYRLITDSTGQTNASTLVAKAEALVDSNIPDYVPFDPQCGTSTLGNDPGLALYRSHYAPSGTGTYTVNDGPRNTTNVTCTVVRASLPHLSLGGGTFNTNGGETGGDVGGAINGPYTSSNLPTVPGKTQASNH